GCQARQPFRFVICPPVFDLHVAAFEEANLVEPFAECRQPRCARLRTTRVEISDHRHPLLRPRRQRRKKRRHDRRAAEQRYELAAFHSITSSARSRNDSGIVSLIALAALRLTTNSNLVACMTGMSAGFSLLRIRPA